MACDLPLDLKSVRKCFHPKLTGPAIQTIGTHAGGVGTVAQDLFRAVFGLQGPEIGIFTRRGRARPGSLHSWTRRHARRTSSYAPCGRTCVRGGRSERQIKSHQSGTVADWRGSKGSRACQELNFRRIFTCAVFDGAGCGWLGRVWQAKPGRLEMLWSSPTADRRSEALIGE